VQGYGLTETSPVITRDDCATIASAPPENQFVMSKFASLRTARLRRAAPSDVGYWNKPAETRAVFTDDGWFKTGDIGFLDEAGY